VDRSAFGLDEQTPPVAWVELSQSLAKHPRVQQQWLRVRLEVAVHEAIAAHCSRFGVHPMRFYRDAFSRGLTALIEDAAARTSARQLGAKRTAREHGEQPSTARAADAPEFALSAPAEPDAERSRG